MRIYDVNVTYEYLTQPPQTWRLKVSASSASNAGSRAFRQVKEMPDFPTGTSPASIVVLVFNDPAPIPADPETVVPDDASSR